jgi:hypothetical protein
MDSNEGPKISNCWNDIDSHGDRLLEKVPRSHWESALPKRQHLQRLHTPVVIALLYTIIISLGAALICSLNKPMRCLDPSQSIYYKCQTPKRVPSLDRAKRSHMGVASAC